MSEKAIIIFKDKKYQRIKFTGAKLGQLSDTTEHKCFDCNKVFNGKCSKVSEVGTKPFYKYPYITSGYQVIDEKGKVDSFVVSSCANYVKDTEANLFTAREETKRMISESREVLRNSTYQNLVSSNRIRKRRIVRTGSYSE